MTKKTTSETATKPSVLMEAEVARRIRQHGRSSMKAEICGVLIGSEQGRTTVVEACIPGVNAAQGGAHVTFTQDTWEHIYKVKDKLYPDERIVGWYHSHPGFGVFLSDHDMFIQENFFSSPQQIAWVYDPHSDEEGCFGWCNKKVEKIDDVAFRYLEKKSEVAEHEIDEDDEVEAPEEKSSKGKKSDWVDVLLTIATYCLVFACGGIIGGFVWSFLTPLWTVSIPRSAVLQGPIVCLALSPADIRCVSADRLRQAEQQMNEMGSGNFVLPRDLQPGTPGTPFSGGQPNNPQGSSTQQQPGQTKGGQDGAKR